MLKLFFSIIGLPDKRLYPSISAVYGNTEVSMVYLGPPLDGWNRQAGYNSSFTSDFVECPTLVKKQVASF